MKLFDVYPLFDIEIVKGSGCRVYDSNGREYIDMYGGHAVISIGHSHPRQVEAIRRQVGELMFYSNSVRNPIQERLAEKLGRASGYDDYALFLVNSGAEANENALKLASFKTGKKGVIAFRHAFHGRTSAAVEATDNPRIVAPINDNSHVTFLPLNDLSAVEARLNEGDISAIIIEGIQGVGGIVVPDDNFMKGLRSLATKYGAVLILDEIQSGYGRTGRFFAHQYADIRPDIITCAKGIANGYPMGAVLISPGFEPEYGQLGTTFGGNHLACVAACAVLDVFEEEGVLENVNGVGEYLKSRLMELPGIKEVRGRGLMLGIEFEFPVKELRRSLIEDEHVFTGASGTHIIRLLPPLVLDKWTADEFMARFSRALKKYNTTQNN